MRRRLTDDITSDSRQIGKLGLLTGWRCGARVLGGAMRIRFTHGRRGAACARATESRACGALSTHFAGESLAIAPRWVQLICTVRGSSTLR
jgi:hypothetical protein